MEKEFVPYEIALALKELGFDEPINASWYSNELVLIPQIGFSDSWINFNKNNLFLSAPLYQQAFRWFREEHDLHNVPLGIKRIEDGETFYHINSPDWRPRFTCDELYETYEEAEVACLRKLIEIVKENL